MARDRAALAALDGAVLSGSCCATVVALDASSGRLAINLLHDPGCALAGGGPAEWDLSRALAAAALVAAWDTAEPGVPHEVLVADLGTPPRERPDGTDPSGTATEGR